MCWCGVHLLPCCVLSGLDLQVLLYIAFHCSHQEWGAAEAVQPAGLHEAIKAQRCWKLLLLMAV